MKRSSLYWVGLLAAVAAAWRGTTMQADEEVDSTDRATEIRVERQVIIGAPEAYSGVASPFLPDVDRERIFAGKRASVIDLEAVPQVQANNYRQALALTPGLLFAEETTPLVSLGYRGIGDPNRAQFLQVLKDGIPIHADPFGYPEAYFTPPLEGVDHLEFIRGGGALMYGPQPAGALNYVTRQPSLDRAFRGRTQHIFGSDNLYSTYTAVDGTSGRLGYLGYFNHRQSDGFRAANSDYQIDGGHFKWVLDGAKESRWTLGLDAYEESHGEPGGLSLGTGPLAVNYREDRSQSSKQYDRFQMRRYIPSVEYQLDFDERTFLSLKSWGGYYDRWSKRQRGGGFGVQPSGGAAASNDIERQEFYSFGIEPRLRHDWEALSETHSLAAGVQLYRMNSPRTDSRGSSAWADEGLVFKDSQRDVLSGALFLENKFTMGRWSITPGFRLETINQDLSLQNYSLATGEVSTKGTKDRTDLQPLLGVGVAYEVRPQVQFYGNVSQSYRTAIFGEALIVPTSGTVLEGDIKPIKGLTYEVGFRGNPKTWITWDSSLFRVDLDNKFGGTVTSGNVTTLKNVGRTVNQGWDGAVQVDVVGVSDALRGTDAVGHWGSFSLFGNVTLLDATLRGGTSDGKVPQYAPSHLVRSGVIYRWQDRVKVAFLGTFMADHFATDDENPERLIPAYSTWDLTAEIVLWRDRARFMAGINNIFDELYYARVRGDGIDPAYGRNYYAGFSLEF